MKAAGASRPVVASKVSWFVPLSFVFSFALTAAYTLLPVPVAVVVMTTETPRLSPGPRALRVQVSRLVGTGPHLRPVGELDRISETWNPLADVNAAASTSRAPGSPPSVNCTLVRLLPPQLIAVTSTRNWPPRENGVVVRTPTRAGSASAWLHDVPSTVEPM